MHRAIDHEVLYSSNSNRKYYASDGDELPRPSQNSQRWQSQTMDSQRYLIEANPSTCTYYGKSTNKDDSVCHPIQNAHWWSKCTLMWLNPLFKLGAAKPLELDDIPSLQTISSLTWLYKNFEQHWTHERKKQSPSLFIAILKTLWKKIALAFFFHALYMGVNLIIPRVVKGIINFLSFYAKSTTSSQDNLWREGLLYASALSLLSFCGATLLSGAWTLNIQLSNEARSLVMDLVYLKAINTTTATCGSFTHGDIITMTTVDSERIFHGLTCICYVILSPVTLLVIFSMVGFEMGPLVAAVGLVTMSTFILAGFVLSHWISKARLSLLNATSLRMTHTKELLQNIGAFKLYTWEIPLLQGIEKLRSIELKCLGWFQLLCNLNIDIFILAPIFTTVSMFATARMLGEPITAGSAFAVVSLMVVARFPCNIFSSAVRYATEAIVSSRRIQEYLLIDTIFPNTWQICDFDYTMCVAVEKAFFSWLPEEKSCTIAIRTSSSLQEPLPLSPGSNRIHHLHNICFYVPRQLDDGSVGSFIAVVGSIGSGKSSLLKSLLGDMNLQACQIFHVTSSKSYCSQKPWLIDDTVRNNILLYRPYLATLYARVLEITNLTKDLASMPSGDLTIVGDKGSSLSGGQRARINLARALYQNDSELYLLDDPLSALDLQVASLVFYEVRRFLKRKHVVMTMNAHHHLLQYATRIITMDNGTILRDEPVTSMKNTKIPRQENSDTIECHAQEAAENTTPCPSIKDEMEGKSINLSETYLRYLNACGMSPWIVLLCMLFFFTLYQTLYYVTDWYLDTYIAAAIGQIEIYSGFAVATVFASLCKDMLIIVVSLRCSSSIHSTAIRRVVAAPLATSLDMASVGDNLNRFSSDLGAMDMDLPYFTYQFLTDTFQTLCILMVVVYFMPLILIIMVPCGYFFISYQMFSLHTTNAVKQLDLASRESLVTCLTETLDGQATISSAGVKNEFIQKYRLAMSINGSCYGTYWLGGTWLELRLGWLSALIVTGVAVALILLRASIDPHIAGLVLVYVISLSANIQEVLRVMSYVQTYMISVSRLLAYESLELENKDDIADSQLSINWPRHGTIRLEKYGLKYQPHLPFALRDLTFSIHAGEKIAICGRTGSGKSSLLSGLMRLIPFTSGAIYIDDVDINQVPINVLRSKITVIPQHPVLFSGTIKYNLDPTNSTHTLILTSVLSCIHLQHLGLDFQVEACGSNLSLGQQQQICFGRALIRRSKIIIQDEATAFMDSAMENKLQDLLMTSFEDTTIITIAHRLQTIARKYNRVLVLDAGAVVEFDSPNALMANTESEFYKLVQSIT